MRKFFKLTAAITAAATALSLAACSQKEKKVKTISYEDAERSYLSEGVGAYSSFFALSEGVRKGKGGELTIEFTPEDYILELMGSGDINPTVFNVKSEVSEDSAYANIAYLNGKKELLSAEMWMKDDAYTMFIPALIDKYITGSLEEGALASLTEAYSGNSPISDMPEPPSDAEIKRITNKVWDKYFEMIKNDAALAKDIDVTLGEITLKCDRTTVDLQPKKLRQLAVTLLEEIKNSGEFMRFLNEIAQTEAYESVDAASEIDNAIAEINAKPDGQGIGVRMTVYVYGKDIVKRKAEFDENGVSNGLISYTVIESGDGYASESVFERYRGSDDVSLSVSDSGTKNGDAYTGSTVVSVKYPGKTHTVNCTYTGLSFDKDGAFNGGAITVSSDDLAQQSFKVDLKFGGDSFTGGLAIGSAKFATVKMTYKPGFKCPAAPSLSDSNSVNADDAEAFSDEIGMQASENLMNLFANADDNGTYDIIWYILQQQMMSFANYQ